MKQNLSILSKCFGVLILCLGIETMALDFTYQTFLIPTAQAKILNQATDKTSSNPQTLLFVANSKEGILYAGNQDLGRCTPLLQDKLESQNEPITLKEGILECKNLALKVENGAILGALTATQNFRLNLKLIDSMVLRQQEITYQYPKNSKQAKNALISTQFHCSNDSKTQKILQSVYQESFDCKNAKEVFLKNSQDSIQNYFKEMLQTNDKEKVAKGIEKYLQTSPFEEYKGESLYYFDNNLLVFLKSNYLYTGGAHGISSKWGVIVSKEKGILPLNTILDSNNGELKSLLWQEYQNYLKSVKAEAFVDFESFRVSDVILLDYDSFVFLYQPYEIMPYAYGIVELRIPLEQMGKFGNFAKTPLESLFVK
ncbi:DUF3298 and DUF4163 domain-containing protein [Helicobacter sp. UBA3407]|uniref:DUF3298 and DUF4163 domain-containing protein n=2 Tax=Helicobacteraceae TaxID=72293 RepID=UPI002626486A|nr:DUF3298 and DUF4163 domain-containing protein [Helicobacter sp. UBA3407]